jgi:hypothetical protein
MASKKIVWKSWNAVAEEYINSCTEELNKIEEELNNMSGEDGLMGTGTPIFLNSEKFSGMHTPFGVFPIDSPFKPSDRWDCWIGTTNFSITQSINKTLKENIDGIEALKIMGRYSFCVGIPCTFDFQDVRLEIEKKLCVFTEKEVMTDEVTETVALMKEQLKHNKYWSILVASTGKLDYVVSDNFDQKYVDGLNQLVELKQKIGGIILRGEDG